jgi:plastocyanin
VQKFTTPGEVRYAVTSGSFVPGATTSDDSDGGGTIEVRAKGGGGEPKQHNVAVSRSKAGRGALVAEPARLTIDAGDNVLWYSTDPSIGFAVAGAGPGIKFGNGALQSEAVYSHAFGTAGTYNWVDAVGGKVAGIVEVTAPEIKANEDRDRWLEQIGKPAMFEIRGGRSSAEEVRIVVGQTVFWKVWDGRGAAVVDRSLGG